MTAEEIKNELINNYNFPADKFPSFETNDKLILQGKNCKIEFDKHYTYIHALLTLNLFGIEKRFVLLSDEFENGINSEAYFGSNGISLNVVKNNLNTIPSKFILKFFKINNFSIFTSHSLSSIKMDHNGPLDLCDDNVEEVLSNIIKANDYLNKFKK